MMHRRVATIFMVALACVAVAKPAGAPQSAPPRYTPDQAKDHVGEFATVEGRVVEVNESAAGNVFVNFGAPYPKNTFTAFVSASDTRWFFNLPRLKGTTVQVTGDIRFYQGKPEIVLTKPAQLRVIASSAK
jgi:DNA/RNA endonuclease YhcR with UshA esterase domain